MVATGRKLTAGVEEYLAELRKIRASGGGSSELSYYLPLGNLLNAVGGSLRPRVHCVSQLGPAGSGTSRLRPLCCQAGAGREAPAGSDTRWRRGGGQARQTGDLPAGRLRRRFLG